MDSLKLFILLALIQGITEFLPISSSGHLAVAQIMLKSFKEPPVAFDLFLHLGTLLATLIFFKNEIIDILKDIKKEIETPLNLFLFKKDSNNKIPAIIYTTIVTALIAFPLKSVAEAAFFKLNYIILAFIITSFLLFCTKFKKANNIQSFNLQKSILIGLAQGLAIFPGISRSGSTISMAIYTGIDSNTAFTFSFLISLPAILGATIIESLPHLKNISINIEFYILSFFIAFISGYISLILLSKIIKKDKIYYFSYYCLLIAIILFVVMVGK